MENVESMEEFSLKHYPKRFLALDSKKNLYRSGELPFGEEIYGDDVAVCDSCLDKQTNSVALSPRANYTD
jgi:hypothetical protein